MRGANVAAICFVRQCAGARLAGFRLRHTPQSTIGGRHSLPDLGVFLVAARKGGQRLLVARRDE